MYGIPYLNAAYLVHNYMSNCCHDQYQYNNSSNNSSNNTTCNNTSNNLICSEQNFYS